MSTALRLSSTLGGGSVGFSHNNPSEDYTITLPNENATMPLMKLMTEQAASGTSVDFTGIPSWVKRITVMFSGVSTNGTSPIIIKLGTSSGIVNSGYTTFGTRLGISGLASIVRVDCISIMYLTPATNAGAVHGQSIITKLSDSVYTSSGSMYLSGFDGTDSIGNVTGGTQSSLSETLDRIRITTANGTDVFDAGIINLLVEGY